MNNTSADIENRYAFFNILRFIGALCIAVFLHSRDHLFWSLMSYPYDWGLIGEFLSKYGFVFVEMFFLMSGILFSAHYRDSIANGNISIGCFLWKRYIRLIPLVVVTEVVCYIEQIVLFFKNGIFFSSCGTLSIISLLIDAFLGGGELLLAHKATLNGSAWYVGVLLLCYIVAYIMVKLSKKYTTVLVYCIPIFAGLLIMYGELDVAILNYDVARGLVAFFSGIYLYDSLKDSLRLKGYRKRILLESAILPVVITIFFIRYDCIDLFASNVHLLFLLLFFPELFCLLFHSPHLNKFFSGKFFVYLGKISYGIILWNFPIYGMYFFLIYNNYVALPKSGAGFVAIMATIHIVSGILSYELIEKRLKIVLCNNKDREIGCVDV